MSTQPAFHAVVHVVLPATRPDGTVLSEDDAKAAIAEALDTAFLDWQYARATDPETGEPVEGEHGLQTPIEVTVPTLYTKGAFLALDED